LFYQPSFLVNDIKEKQFDYIVLGSSTGLTTLNTKVIDSVMQTNGLNLSMDDTALSSQYLMLQHFLAQGKTTKFCVLAPSASSFDAKNVNLSDNDYRFLPYINTNYVSDYFGQYSSQSAHLLRLSKWMPILGLSYFNVELFYPSLLSAVKPKKRNRFDDRGNYTYPIRKNQNQPISAFKELPINFSNVFVEKISALCELNSIELICYFSPINGKKAVTNRTDLTIVNHSDLLKNTRFFYDFLHVNHKGRQVSSLAFSNAFKKLLY